MSAVLDSVSAIRLPMAKPKQGGIRKTIFPVDERRLEPRNVIRVESNVLMHRQPEVLKTLKSQGLNQYRRLGHEMTLEWQPADCDWSWCDTEVAFTLKAVMGKRKSRQLFVSPTNAGRVFGVHRTTIARYFEAGHIAGCYVNKRLFVVLPSIYAFLNHRNLPQYQ